MFGLFKSPKSGQQDVQQQPAPASIDPIGAGAYGIGNPGGSAPAGPSPWGMHEAPMSVTPGAGLIRTLMDPGTGQENVQPQYARPIGTEENLGGFFSPFKDVEPQAASMYPNDGGLGINSPVAGSMPGIAGFGQVNGHGPLGWPSES